MPSMTHDELEVLAIVVAHDAPMRFTELGHALYGSSCTLDHAASRARTRGMRLVSRGALAYAGRYGAISPTERGRIALALAMARDGDIERRFFGGASPPQEPAGPRPQRRRR